MAVKIINADAFQVVRGITKKSFLRVHINGAFELSQGAADLMHINPKDSNCLSFYEDADKGVMYLSQLGQKGFALNKNGLKFSNTVFMKHFVDTLKLPLGKPIGNNGETLQLMRLAVVESPKVDGFAGLFKIEWNESE